MDSWTEQSNMTYKYTKSKKMPSWWVAQKYDLYISQSFRLSPYLQLLNVHNIYIYQKYYHALYVKYCVYVNDYEHGDKTNSELWKPHFSHQPV